MNIRPMGVELLHADGQKDGMADWQTDMTKQVAAYRNFANAAKSIKQLIRQPAFQDAILQQYDTVSLGNWLQTFRSAEFLSSWEWSSPH